MTRRFWAPAALATALLASAAAAVKPVTILHTNDLHARMMPLENGHGGFARVAAVIRRERAGCHECVLLNAGDLVQGSPVSTIFQGLPVFQIANLFRFQASTLGNHDFDYGWEQARKFVQTAKYPIALANLVDADNHLFVKRPYVILKVNGVRLAVIGAMTDDFMTSLSTPKARGPWHTEAVVATVRKYAAEARKSSDLVVLLGHLTSPEEQEFLHKVPDIPVMVTGHSHNGIKEAETDHGRVMVRVKAYGEEVGRLELKVDTATKSVSSWIWKRIPVDDSVEAAPDVAKAVQHWEAEVARKVDMPLATSSRAFTKPEVKALLERAMCASTGADFAFMNMGGVRDTLPQGQLLVRHVWNIMPFDNLVVTGKFKGSQLPKIIQDHNKVDPNRDYTLAVSDFTAANQNAPSQLRTEGLHFSEDGPLLRDVLLEYIRAQKILN